MEAPQEMALGQRARELPDRAQKLANLVALRAWAEFGTDARRLAEDLTHLADMADPAGRD